MLNGYMAINYHVSYIGIIIYYILATRSYHHISSTIVLFLKERSRIFLINIKFYLGRTKRRGKREVWGKKPKMSIIFAKFPLLSKKQTLSHKLLVRQTSNRHHWNWHSQKPICRDFQVISSSSSWSKTILCIFKEEIWLPNRKCCGKKNSIVNGTGFEAVHSDVSELWAICMH